MNCCMDQVLRMNGYEMIRYFQKIGKDEFLLLLREKDKLLNLDIGKFNLLYLNVNDELKKMLLDDVDLFEKLMAIPLNRMGKSLIDLSDEEIQSYIYNHPNLLESVSGKKLVEGHLRKLNRDRFEQLLGNPNLNHLYQKDIFKDLQEKFTLTVKQVSVVESAIQEKKFSPLALFRLKNTYEVFLYAKFGILVSVLEVQDQDILIGERWISYDFLEKVNRKHMVSLLDLMKKKQGNCSNEELFIGVSKLYMALGFDNSKKVIQDFFTYGTKASIKRASDELFKDTRREYRLKNQHKFYYYGMEYDFLKALRENDLSYFLEFFDREKKDVEVFLEHIKKEMERLPEEKKTDFVKNLILAEIQYREKVHHDRDTKKYQKYYQSVVRTEPIEGRDLYNIFGNICLNYSFHKEGKLVPDDILTRFLLGNCKRDNDCLLRMVFNHEALGLDGELYQVLNHFEKIKEIVDQDSHLSMYSILDIIDVSKVFLYQMRPDELDITLETFSKILNSRKYCTEDPEIILKRVMALHKKRKRKVACAIPSIKGEFLGARYWVSEFDDERLLVSGIDTGSCFKVGGKGEEFFEYCLTNPCGLVFYIEYCGVEYILPSTVNGNMLNINSIDPRISDPKTYQGLFNVIKKMAQEVVMDSKSKVEMVTITDIHHEEFMRDCGCESVVLKKFIPLDTDFYCDYNKKEVTNYIVCRKDFEVSPRYFVNRDLFYQERPKPYIISPKYEYDRERVEIMINAIGYSSIEFMDIGEEEKERERYWYHPYHVDDFIYIIGSRDWFIGLHQKEGVICYLLPYDERAKEEFRKYQGVIQEFMEQSDGKKRH